MLANAARLKQCLQETFREDEMQRSQNRILTTHVGSLPRPADLLSMVRARASGGAVDEASYGARLRGAVADIVQRQIDCGIDIVNDGEMSKQSFLTYVGERFGGFAPDPDAPKGSPFANSREFKAFPEFYQWAARARPPPAAGIVRLGCMGPVVYKGHAQLKADLDNLKAAVAGKSIAEVFVPAIAPASVEDWFKNRHY